jgi:GNAT superfamily N-acetyltransferase
MPTMMIRPLHRADAALFHAHRLAALQESPEAFGSTFEEDRLLSPDTIAERIEETFVAPRRVVLGAFAEDTLQGFVGCMQEHKAKSRHKAIVWGTYVHPDARGQGVGRALLAQLIVHVREWESVERLTLTVVERALAARALYRAVGFEQFGREPDGLRQDGLSDTVEYWTLQLRPRVGANAAAG